jgi:hypothetical protein
MPQSSPPSLGLGVHQDSMAVASVATAHDTEVICLGPIGTRHAASDQLVRQPQANAKHPVFGDEAGPCRSWLCRELTETGRVCCAVAPSRSPTKAGARGCKPAGVTPSHRPG